MTNATVALTMIIKDESDNLHKIISDSLGAFDQMVFVISDKETYEKARKWDWRGFDSGLIEFYYREWTNRFDEARNFALDKVKTDYWFWLDADDTFDFDYIKDIVRYAEDNSLDQVLLPYHYAHNEQGQIVALHWRERLVRTSHPFKWKGWVHEALITDEEFRADRVNAPVIHSNSEEHTKESVIRNHNILLEAVKESDDPRYMLYLGSSLHALKDYRNSIKILDKYLEVSGSVDDSYRALCLMAEDYYLLNDFTSATDYALKASGLMPEYPQAYFLLAQWELFQDNYAECIEWVKVGDSKPDPNSLAVYDPTMRERAYLMAAQSEFTLGNYNRALKWLRRMNERNPMRRELESGFLNEADAETFIQLLPKFEKYFESRNALYMSLTNDLRYDQRLRGLRESVVEPTTWDDKSIVIFCGEGYEEWGPHTLDKGMGGSEEAVVYLSRELAKLGWNVTVYGAVEQPLADGDNVWYLPWKQIDRRDNFNVFVAWRAPDFAKAINAKVKIADIHDILPKESVQPDNDITYFVKSNFHRGLYPDVPDEQFKVIGNGLKKGQF